LFVIRTRLCNILSLALGFSLVAICASSIH
jgi:hypothetical protein